MEEKVEVFQSDLKKKRDNLEQISPNCDITIRDEMNLNNNEKKEDLEDQEESKDYLESSIDDEIDFSDLEAKYHIPFKQDFGPLIIVDGIPQVPEEKREALLKILKKQFSTVGKINEERIFMPMEERNGVLFSKGYLFMSYQTQKEAEAAIKAFNGKKLDKAHTFLINKFTDVETALAFDEEYKETLEEKAYENKNLYSWLIDPKARDQWVMYKGDDVGIYWNQKSEAPESIIHRINWTETYIHWSPLGTYLASFHRPGIQLWGGESWGKIARFPHPSVKLIDFSPCERYLVTWSNEPIPCYPEDHPGRLTFGSEDEGKSIIIWDIKTGVLLKSFNTSISSGTDTDEVPRKITWPMYKWSSDGSYFAKVTPGQHISVYETPSMTLVGKKHIKIDGVVDFEWSPSKLEDKKGNKEYLLCYWTPEINNQPARTGLLSIPSKETIRTKNLFNVSDCKLHWQSQGNLLCVKVDRHTKTKKSTFTNLEIFRIHEKNIPVEVIEIKDVVINFAWEPNGDRFALITTSDSNFCQGPLINVKNSLSFYCTEKSKGSNGNFKLIRTFTKKTCNSLYWAPNGRFIVAATLGNATNFDIEFWDLDFEGEKKDTDKDLNANLQLMGTAEHYGVTDIEWDPSGRYLTSSVSIWRHRMENGYRLWDFKGSLLREEHNEGFKQLLWRPRPPSLLSKEQQKKIRKNLKEYSRAFEKEDVQEQNTANKELIAHRRRLLEEWNAWRSKVISNLEKEKKELGIVTDTKEEKKEKYIKKIIEVVISEEIEEVTE
ncbi:hypothetical protein PNEG_00521 [Pneumocystis murina B123]|uniref:Eukaryotic translation initiation factor 3 subunit B n=1 Tax=Pneumocystis murina (strain B123) TaxID=1069680 RepID=M7NRX8_PNEMU|nr:hypothetical protein PNEG_00521 [Pneumocystis murina B123]EMR11508.1 hypothetical protein PNEG_00521 [Pneumocystis murina B123]